MKKKCCLFDIARMIESHFRNQAIQCESQFSISFIPSSEPFDIYQDLLKSELEKVLLPALRLSKNGMVELKIKMQTDQQHPVLYYQICDSRQAGILEKTIRFIKGQSWVEWLELFGTKYQGEFHLNVVPFELNQPISKINIDDKRRWK